MINIVKYISLVATSILLASCSGNIPPTPKTIENCSDPVVVPIVHSIIHTPSSWETDMYRVTNGTVSVWIANEDYGISIAMGTNVLPDQYTSMSDQCKLLMFNTYQDYLRNLLSEEF